MMRKTLRLLIPTLTIAATIGATMPPATPATLGRTGSYVFTGAGFGHGVGMSQWGAKGMADAGSSAPDILGHYYQGTSISSAPQPDLRIHLADTPNSPGFLFFTSAPVRVTTDAGTASVTVDARDGGDPAVISANSSGLQLSKGPDLLMGPTPGPFVIRLDPTIDPGLSAIVRLPITGKAGYNHGRIEISQISTGLRAVVRDIAMDKYLYGLGEVPSSWPIEAQKTQAIAARTYAFQKWTVQQGTAAKMNTDCSCNLYSTVADQNYVGYGKETESAFPNWKLAVDSTSSSFVSYNAQPIQAFYSASSGGFTENSENVFVANLPYLRGVPDPGDDAASPYAMWKRTYLGTDLERWLNAAADTAIGLLSGIKISGPYGVSGRILRPSLGGGVKIVGVDGTTKVVSGERFKQVVNAGLSTDGRTSEVIRSTLYQLGFEHYSHLFRGGTYIAGGVDHGTPIVVTGPDYGGGPHIVESDQNGKFLRQFYAYDPNFTGGVRVAVCDIFGNGDTEVLTGPGTGGGPHVRYFDLTGGLINEFYAFDKNFTGGIYVACGNLDGVPGDEIVVGSGPGFEPRIRVFNGHGDLLADWNAYDWQFGGGVRVAVGDLNGSNPPEIITGPGRGGGPDIRAYDANGQMFSRFSAFDPNFTGGVFPGYQPDPVRGKIVIGAGEGGGSDMKVFQLDGTMFVEYLAFGGVMANGVRVANTNGQLIASTGRGGWPIVRIVP